MKLVLAIIKPHKVDEVREALGAIGVQGLTISEARGYGRQKGHTEIYRGAEYETSLVPKIRLEVVAEDEKVVVTGTIRATMLGALVDVAPTDRRFELPFMGLWWVHNGAIVRERLFFDLNQMCEQLGVPTDLVAGRLRASRRPAERGLSS